MKDVGYTVERWMPLWRFALSDARIEGPAFRTRRECRAFIEKRWGYIKTRKDLRIAPFWWRLPKAIRVEIRIRPK